MRIKYLLVVMMLFVINFNTYSQWVQQPTGESTNLKDVRFNNLNTGWVSGDGIILKTTNSGVNWISQQQPSTNLIQGIYPVSSDIVYACGWFNTFLKTTNGGVNWSVIRNGIPPDGPTFESVYFINENTGWVAGNVVVFKTTDGGISFDSVRVEAYLKDIYFKNSMEGVACGDVASFYKTSNGGLNWERIQVVTGTSQYSFAKLSFVDDFTGWLIGWGDGGPVYKTTDFGSTWDSIGLVGSDPNNIFPIEFINVNTGWAGGEFGVVYKTTDGGVSWLKQNTNQFNNGLIRSMYAYNDSIVWAVGNLGKILHTTNGGVSSILQTGNEIPGDFEVLQNYPNPFNSSTNIVFKIRERGIIRLEVYDMLGKRIDFMNYGSKDPGTYTVSYNADKLSSGIYFYKLYTGERFVVKKFVLTK